MSGCLSGCSSGCSSAAPTCPCGCLDTLGRPRLYVDCCGPCHAGQPAPDAQALMRSRYSAFVREDAAYLLATWHTSTRPAQIDFEPGLRWLGLQVRAHRVLDSDHAEVEFVARSRLAGRGQRLHERSRFVREGGRWVYLDGQISASAT